jgi:hypothetical protein
VGVGGGGRLGGVGWSGWGGGVWCGGGQSGAGGSRVWSMKREFGGGSEWVGRRGMENGPWGTGMGVR